VAKEGAPSSVPPARELLREVLQIQSGFGRRLHDDKRLEGREAVQGMDDNLQLRGDESMTGPELRVMRADTVRETVVVRRDGLCLEYSGARVRNGRSPRRR
jgi:hypothetical protein